MLLCAESQGRREILLENLAKADLFPEPIANWRDFLSGRAALGITVAPLDRGIYLGPGNRPLSARPSFLGSASRSGGADTSARKPIPTRLSAT